MIEQAIVLRNDGTVPLPLGVSELKFGYTKNRGVYRLVVRMQDEWDGMTIRACWHIPGCSECATTLVEDGAADVPAAVTAVAGRGSVTFEGSDGERTLTSADVKYRVRENSGTDEGEVPEPGTSAWQAFINQLTGGGLSIAEEDEVAEMLEDVFGKLQNGEDEPEAELQNGVKRR